jgi:hypothetical protein
VVAVEVVSVVVVVVVEEEEEEEEIRRFPSLRVVDRRRSGICRGVRRQLVVLRRVGRWRLWRRVLAQRRWAGLRPLPTATCM